MKQTHHLAQANSTRKIAPIDSPVMFDFVRNLDRINEIAEKHDGFIWRLKEERNIATAFRVLENNSLINNMSVRVSINMLFKCIYSSKHLGILERKKEWSMAMKEMRMAFCYLSLGHHPIAVEAKAGLNCLNEKGETAYPFTFKSKFTSEDAINFNPKI